MSNKWKSRVFVVHYADGTKTRIIATRMKLWYSPERYMFWSDERDGDDDGNPDATVSAINVVSVVPLDMLRSTFEESSVLPDVVNMSSEEIDLVEDALFSEEDKEPFTQKERRLIQQALGNAVEKIREEYSPDPGDLANIQQKIDYLSKKVVELGKFDWKRLFVATLVGISIDLGFGSVIPATLAAFFTEVLGHLSKKIGNKGNDEAAC